MIAHKNSCDFAIVVNILLYCLEECVILSKKRSKVFIISRTIYFFFDDSGILHTTEQSGYFVYAGYVFLSRKDLDNAKRKYINANKKIKKSSGMTGELKASVLSASRKRSLVNVMKGVDSVSLAVKIDSLYPYVVSDKKSICRYKDYVLKRCIKSELIELIRTGRLRKTDDVRLEIFIDEQLTATNGYYSLQDSIYEELKHGIMNFDYDILHQNVFDGEVEVHIQYCESKNNYMIQASDILANRVWTSYRIDRADLRDSISNHRHLTFP